MFLLDGQLDCSNALCDVVLGSIKSSERLRGLIVLPVED